MPAPQQPDENPAASGEQDGYRTDIFSRNDEEGLPSEAEVTGREASFADVNRALDAGEEGGYRTDTFSRNDGEGLPGDAELIDAEKADPKPAQGGGAR